MSRFDDGPALAFAFRRRMPVLLQSEAGECALACVAMIATWHGRATSTTELRRRFSISLKGITLKHLAEIADGLGFACRPVRLELDELSDLRTPCILHWDLNHFVVLASASRSDLHIIDPAVGRRRLTPSAASAHFTGVALELEPRAAFASPPARPSLPLRSLFNQARGLKAAAAQALALALALETVVLASPFFMQWVVDGALPSADRDLLLLLALGFGLLVVIQAAISTARSWLILEASTRLALHWQGSLFAHLLRLPAGWFERRHLGDIVSRFGSLTTIQRTLTASFIESLIDGVMACATLLLMAFYSPVLAAVALLAAALYILFRWTVFGPLRAAAQEQVVLSAKASSLFMESVRAIASIKISGHEHERQSRWMNATVEASNRGIVTEKIGLLQRAGQTLVSGLEYVLIVYLGGVAVIEGAFSVGMLLAFVAYRTTFSNRIGALTDKWIQLKMLGMHKDRLSDIALEPPEQTESRCVVPPLSGKALEATGVSFRYGDMEPWVLKDLVLAFEPGECVAITGSSGCGKTTLVKILMGLLQPSEGDVRLGGVPIDGIGTGEFRRRIAGVMQDDLLLAGSIADNICFFDPRPDLLRVQECARLACVDDEILAMPMRYETLVGDMGSSLSGGQKQRILLARALYKQPELLFLDEATSHLDVRRETQINEAVRALRITRIIVAHRPHTIASADRVIVLEAGGVKQDLRVSSAFADSFPRPITNP